MQTAIRQVTFVNGSDNPSSDPRLLEVRVFDGTYWSNKAATSINVTPQNRSSCAGPGREQFVRSHDRQLHPRRGVGGVGVNRRHRRDDRRPGQPVHGPRTITLTNAQAGDRLDVGALNNISAATVTTGTTTTITLTGLSGATNADFKSRRSRTSFLNTSAAPSTTARTITVVVYDGQASSATATTTVNILTAPTIDLDGNDSSGATAQGSRCSAAARPSASWTRT